MILDHVQLAGPPGCEENARRFYGDLLGLAEIAKPEAMRGSGGVWFSLGAQELHIGIEDPFTPARKAHAGLRVEPPELETLADRLTGAGAKVEWDERYPGVRRFYTADPFGNRIEIGAPG
ncbi:MAG TPA: VOC family protein [Thermoleophilaceae bacterium]|nr:VOC family protein [Thermoleophilaceae bacterium]